MWERFFRWIWIIILGVMSLFFKSGHVQEAPQVDPDWREPEWHRKEQPHVHPEEHPHRHLRESYKTVVVSGETLPPGQILMPESVRSYATGFPFGSTWVTNTATTRLDG